ncbi:MAG TPA: ABC transporter ATP-binding protein [Roseiarcus sp.]|nr:ABC transporter ATP-binding protein [Roseiarcus sp.]
MQPMLTFANVELFYDHIYALKGVSLQLMEGETVALIGANGAGKSSILRAITGLRKIRSGQIHFEGRRIDGLGPEAIVGLGIAMVPEGRRVFPYMSVRDNLLMGAFSRKDSAGVRATMDMVLARFPRLQERYRQAAGTMSGGEQQMLVIGRALMAKPRLLLLDEPSLGVAPKIVQDIARSIVSINRDDKVSVLLVEQNSRMALRVSHRAYALTTGSVALTGASADLVKDARVQQLYLGGDL